jgi:hypothetical protein
MQWPNEKGQMGNLIRMNGQMKRDKWGSCNLNDTIQWPNEKGQMVKL